MAPDYVFIGGCLEDNDTNLWTPEDHLFEIQPHWNMANVMVTAGVFKSTSEARKNGWNMPLPTGWAEFSLPKRFGNASVCIWNPTKYQSEFSDEPIGV